MKGRNLWQQKIGQQQGKGITSVIEINGTTSYKQKCLSYMSRDREGIVLSGLHSISSAQEL